MIDNQSHVAYRELAAAATQLVELDAYDSPHELPADIAVSLLEQNRAHLTAARAALAKGCAVPLSFDRDYYSQHDSLLCQQLRRLARVFHLEAFVANRTGDDDQVVQIGVDLLDLGNATRRGGLICDQLVSVAIASVGIDVLRRIRVRMSSALRRLLLMKLRHIKVQRETFAVIAARDESWTAATGADEEPEGDPYATLFADDTDLSPEDQEELREALSASPHVPDSVRSAGYSDIDDASLTMLRLLTVDMALRLAQTELGRYPASLTELVPTYLPHMPLDPFTSQPLCYIRSADSFLLYSTGPKRTDAGGQFGSWPAALQHQADLCLDANDFPVECRLS
jgi:hypothetical protein